ncbi:hypothetical protein [Shimia thalassica]|uniref:hypothetical protein n=1 Tax=Shimia thalassica TaxID=1715693 RepID=UPI0026E3A744|nr:hypothetical protein [Shimia thalassica]MDO6483567.1 hypothetical protein [Shimia thalassica]
MTIKQAEINAALNIDTLDGLPDPATQPLAAAFVHSAILTQLELVLSPERVLDARLLAGELGSTEFEDWEQRASAAHINWQQQQQRKRKRASLDELKKAARAELRG